MKKYILRSFFLAASCAVVFVSKTNQAGPGPGYTNAPSESNCATGGCHSDFALQKDIFKNNRGSVIATLDGDLQNDPADLPEMIKLLGEADMVCGVRAKRMDSFVRRASSRIARKARTAVLGVDFADTGCNLRVFRRSAIEALPAFDGIHRFMPIFAHNTGLRVRELPVRHHPRTLGVSKYGVWNRLGRGIRDLIMVGWFIRRQIGRKVASK